MNQTVFALATTPGRSALAVLRLTGPGAKEALAALGVKPTPPRLACLRRLYDREGELIDRAIVIRFAAPNSYTGEHMAELHVHGGEAVVDAVTSTLMAAGCRPAEAGEITRRAFEHGKLDLDQAEGVADLVDARTKAQARQAVRQLGGALGQRYEGWRQALVSALARFETAVDFPDEELPPGVVGQAVEPLRRVLAEIEVALADGKRGERIRDGYRIAIIGAPNSGKSSLFNALLEREAAIVAPTPGATRDVLEASLALDAFRVVLADMAGLRETDEAIEAEGVRRARAWAGDADLRLWLVDGAERGDGWRYAAELLRPADICLINKTDLPASSATDLAIGEARRAGASVMRLCLVRSGDADEVRQHLRARLACDLAGGEFPAVTRERHRRVLGEARDHLIRSLAHIDEPELAAEDARLAARSLTTISGKIGAEDVLTEVFANFCIGK